MKKIILFILIVVTTILFTSCTTHQRVVYRQYDYNITPFGFGWNSQFWGGWNNLNLYPHLIIPRYYIRPYITHPQHPTRYERRQSIGGRPNRINNDNTYPLRTPIVPRIEVSPLQQNNSTFELKPKWYAPQQSPNGMVTPRFRYQSNDGAAGFNGPGAFERNYQ
jgi:hypothetical protein